LTAEEAFPSPQPGVALFARGAVLRRGRQVLCASCKIEPLIRPTSSSIVPQIFFQNQIPTGKKGNPGLWTGDASSTVKSI